MPRSPFQPSRLSLARRLRGLTQAALAKRSSLSPAAISQFESGAATPAPETLQQLAVVLGCKPEFFFRPGSGLKIHEPFFRSLRSTRNIERERAGAYAEILAETVELLEKWIELPQVEIPRPLQDVEHHLARDIEVFAVKMRAAWQIPPGPIANVTSLLESKGSICAAVGDFSRKLDAFSLKTTGRPLIILCSNKGVAARRRFDACHELGHLVLHSRPRYPNREQEAEAHRFASSFLMPAEEIIEWLPRQANDLELLQEGSMVWGVSMQALLLRGRDLHSISESEYQRAMKRMSAMGWRTREPVDIGPPERPELLTHAVAALREAGSSLAQLASEVGITPKRMARMLSVPEDRQDQPEARVVKLPGTAA